MELTQGEHTRRDSFFGTIYEELIRVDHLFRRIAATVAFHFVSRLMGACHCPDNERSSWDAVVLFKRRFPTL